MNESKFEKTCRFLVRLFFIWLGIFYSILLLFNHLPIAVIIGASFMMFTAVMNLFFLIDQEIQDKK